MTKEPEIEGKKKKKPIIFTWKDQVSIKNTQNSGSLSLNSSLLLYILKCIYRLIFLKISLENLIFLYIKIEQTFFCFLAKVGDEGNSCLNVSLKPTQEGKMLENCIVMVVIIT